MTTKETALNTLIAGPDVNTNLISDGYHSFGELYNHRITLFIALCALYDDTGLAYVWRSKKHSDGSVMEGWFVMGINDEHGKQITYHLPMSEWDNTSFASDLPFAPPWDGHTSEDVLNRLRKLANN
jgi:hypothetical protein